MNLTDQNLGVLPAIPAAVTGAVSLAKKVGQAVAKLKDLGKNSPGLQYRKLAAGINYFKSLGYTNAQMAEEPIRSLIIAAGGDEQFKISTVAEWRYWQPGGAFENKYFLPAGGPSILPSPAGRPSTYVQPPDGAALTPLVQAVFGPIPAFGLPLTKADVYAYAPGVPQQSGPPTYSQTPTYTPIPTGGSDITSSYASGAEQNTTPPPPPPAKQANMGLIVGIGVAALGLGIMATMPKQKGGRRLSGTKRKTTKRRKKKS